MSYYNAAISDFSTAAERFGRSRENWTVHFRGDARVGDVVRVRVEHASQGSLRGVQVAVVDPAAVAPAPRPRRTPQRGEEHALQPHRRQAALHRR